MYEKIDQDTGQAGQAIEAQRHERRLRPRAQRRNRASDQRDLEGSTENLRQSPLNGRRFWVPGMRIGYARISEEDQSLPLQRQALQAVGCEQVYEGRARGKTTRRPQRDACLQGVGI